MFVLGLRLGDQFGAFGEAAAFEFGVRFQSRAPGLLELTSRTPQRLGQAVAERIDDFTFAHAHVNQRGQHARGIEVVHHQGAATCGRGPLHERAHRRARGFFVCRRILDVRNEDEVDAILGGQLRDVTERELGGEAEIRSCHARAKLANLVGGLPRQLHLVTQGIEEPLPHRVVGVVDERLGNAHGLGILGHLHARARLAPDALA